MTIEVTREDIQHGRRCDPDCCPIGRALSRAGVDHLGVVGSTVLVADRHKGARALRLPGNVKNWIVAFDGAQPVEPITFELPVGEGRPQAQLSAA